MNLPLTKTAETATTVTLAWTPVPCLGYVLYADGIRKSNSWDPGKSSWKTDKAAVIRIVAVAAVAEGVYPPVVVPPPSTGLRFALGSNGDQTASAVTGQSLGVKLMRTYDQNPTASLATVKAACDIYISRGIQPYVLFNDSSMFNGSFTSMPGNFQALAAGLGPGGSSYGSNALAPAWFEIGNELFYNYKSAGSKAWVSTYAPKLRDSYQAIKAGNPNVKVLVPLECDNQGDSAYQEIVDRAYAAVANFHNYVDGWVFHCYGPLTNEGTLKINKFLTRYAAKGAPSTIPVYLTEDGISSDNGRTLSNNYGWPTNVTYTQAGANMRSKFAGLQTLPWGSRLKLWTQYQSRDQAATGTTNGREAYFGVVQSNQAAKGDITQAVRDFALTT